MSFAKVSVFVSALVALSLCPSEGVNLAGSKDKQHLQPNPFVETMSEDEAIAFIQAKLKEVPEDETSSGMESQLMKTIAPVLKDMLKGILGGMRPTLREECLELVQEISNSIHEHEATDDFSFSQQKQQESAAVAERSEGFFDSLKEKLGGLMSSGGGPILKALLSKLKPMLEGIGKKLSGPFAGVLGKVLKQICHEVEEEVGLGD